MVGLFLLQGYVGKNEQMFISCFMAQQATQVSFPLCQGHRSNSSFIAIGPTAHCFVSTCKIIHEREKMIKSQPFFTPKQSIGCSSMNNHHDADSCLRLWADLRERKEDARCWHHHGEIGGDDVVSIHSDAGIVQILIPALAWVTAAMG